MIYIVSLLIDRIIAVANKNNVSITILILLDLLFVAAPSIDRKIITVIIIIHVQLEGVGLGKRSQGALHQPTGYLAAGVFLATLSKNH